MRDIKIIASSISNLTDARYFAAKLVDALSFDLSKVNRDEYFAIKDWVEGISILIETKEEFTDLEIHEADGIIYHRDDDLQDDDVLASSTIVSGSIDLLGSLPHQTGHILRNHDWDMLTPTEKKAWIDFAFDHECYLDVSIPLSELEPIINDEKLYGLVCRGGDEEKVGFKSFDELDDMFDLLDF